MRILMRRLIVSVGLCGVLWLPVASAAAADAGLNHFVDGVEFFDQADYGKALASFDQAVALEPDNLQYQYYIGLTRKAQKRDDEALAILAPILSNEPVRFINGFFEVAEIHQRHNRLEEALAALLQAKKAGPNNPRVHLEKGLLHKEMGQYDQAIASFNRAMAMDADMTQAAYYNIAAVHVAQRQLAAAEAMFNKAIAVDPASATAINARLSIDNIRKAERALKPWYVSASLTWGYDTNVPLDPLDQVTNRPTDQPSGQEDQFQALDLIAGYKFINQPDLEVGVGYHFRNIGYRDWTDNNLLAHRPQVFLRYNREPFYFSLKYEFSAWYEGGSIENRDIVYLTFTDVSEDSLLMNTLAPSLIITEPYGMTTQIDLTWQARDYAAPDESDSRYYAVELVQTFSLAHDIVPRIGYKYILDNADVDTETYHYNIGYVGVTVPLARWKTRFDAALYYGITDFSHNPNYAATGSRQDDQYRLTASLTRPLSDHFRVKLYYDHTSNDSNVTSNGADPFEFRKNLYALILSAIF